jgi:hypothetical protein
MSMNSVSGVLNEQTRIYRACVNGHLKPSDMCRMMFGLREIRASVEAIPTEAAPTYRPPEIVIRPIPSGYGIDPHDPERLVPLLAIEHVAGEQVEMPPRASLERGLKPFARAQTIEAEPADEGQQREPDAIVKLAHDLGYKPLPPPQ